MKTIVFDFGNVLINYEPKQYCRKYTACEADADLLYQKVFCSLEWLKLDRGVIEEEDAISGMCEGLPSHLKQPAIQLVHEWHSELTINTGICDLIRELKACGYPIYLLSNTSAKFHSLIPKLAILQEFTGIFISADVHLLKPDLAIYRTFLQKFELEGTDCFFIDDNPSNVEAAQYCGMHAFCYAQNDESLRAWLTKKGIFA